MTRDEATQQLELGILLPTEVVPSGGEVLVSLSLVNRGADPVDAPSLCDNSQVTNYIITRDDGAHVATVNDVSRQRLLRLDQRLNLDLVTMRTLAPGEEQTFAQNLQLMIWLDQPGSYLIQGLYRWQGTELRSAAVPLEIEPASVTAHDHQWCHHYGEEYLLHTTWVHEAGGTRNIVLRESSLFDPHAINFNRQVFGQDEPCQPRVSQNATLLASSHVWLAWLDGSRAHCLRTDQGEVAGLPESFEVDLQQPEMLTPPLMLADRSLLMLFRGSSAAAPARVQGIRVDQQGQEVGRALLPDLFEHAGQLQVLLDLDGALHLLWTEAGEGGKTRVLLLAVDPETLTATGQQRQVFCTPNPVLRLLAPPVLSKHEALACLIQDNPRHRPHELALQRFHYLGDGSPPAPAPFCLPEDRPVALMDGRLDADATFHLLALTEDRQILYYNDHRQKVTTVAQLTESDLPTPLCLVLTPDCDAHAVYRRADRGLREVLLRTRQGDEDWDY